MEGLTASLPIVIAILVLVGLVLLNKAQKTKSLQVCIKCGTKSHGKPHMRGSIFIEIIGWLMFIIPGLIYSIWRHTTSAKICPTCKSNDLVPISSPAAQSMLERLK